ncbi:MAG: glutamine synthetase III [Deltaproteobacteria bacterium]|jgi:glutamine synthetase|nr:glutamine synthetase III [Deltaproteobacteria bacterium]
MSIPRNKVRAAVAAEAAHPAACPLTPYKPSEIYSRDVFNLRVMRERLPKDVFKRLEEAGSKGKALNDGDADIVAGSMRDWAIEKGATHFTHWFQPMTGITAEKHDAFITPDPFTGRLLNEFSGKMLIKGEPDASSFPSGGLRSTFEARGYTAWDPSSPAFLLENSRGKTLYVPTIFFSYTGESLDRKTPLLRSLSALSKQALRVLRLFGNTSATYVNAMVGSEQEYFLVDRRYYALRDDLKLAGRTLFGSRPSKGQEREDHYFGAIGQRVLNFMAEVEERMLALGIPARTRHNEVAPAQFELAPMFEAVNLATDHNMLTMEILRNVAEKHGLACLLHEKPFAGINGSGKHNNWSLCDSDGNNLLDPGATPTDNAQFLVFLAAVLKAVHKYAIALRLGTVGAGNDHRLGANEAPPAILSVFLGEQLTEIVTGLAEGKSKGTSSWKQGVMQVGISSLPSLPRDATDRNRTSPFAFTGNKFEFRAVGASQSIAPANIALNAAVASTLDDIATELETATAAGASLGTAVQSLLARYYKESLPVVFNGNGYSAEWEKEAEKRGLPNLRDSVTVISHYTKPEVMDLFLRHGVLSEREQHARQEILLDNYIIDVQIETKLVSSIGRSAILPTGLRWLRELGEAAKLARELAKPRKNEALLEESCYADVRFHVEGLKKGLDELDTVYAGLEGLEDTLEKAEAARDRLLPLMAVCREHADALEVMVDDAIWPLPKYNELLW